MGNLKQSIRNQAVKLYLNGIYPIILRRRAKRIGKKDKIEVVFFAMNVAMWRYQGIYDLLSREDRFNCHIVLSSARRFSKEQRVSSLEALRVFFNSKGIPYYDYDEKTDIGYNVKGLIDPDILFYPQPYVGLFQEDHCFKSFTDKLWCYVPYALTVLKNDWWIYDMRFHNLAWKIYSPTLIEYENARKAARNHGRNWIISGYTNLDKYCSEDACDVWKIKDKSLKRLIWAPHFSIVQESSWIHRSNFLRMSQLMIDIADTYKDKLQIAFKPHPWLKSELYKHPDWGKEKTDSYFDRWMNGDNTQLETGDFVDLFKTSDAMIHDSGSFTAEYLYVNKPVAFVTADYDGLLADHNVFGQAALKQHYIIKDEQDVLDFVNNVVIGGDDPKAHDRTRFFNDVLMPNVTGTTSQFIVNDIKHSLGIS